MLLKVLGSQEALRTIHSTAKEQYWNVDPHKSLGFPQQIARLKRILNIDSHSEHKLLPPGYTLHAVDERTKSKGRQLSLAQTPKELGLKEAVWVSFEEPPAPVQPKVVESPLPSSPPSQKKSAVVVPPQNQRSPVQQQPQSQPQPQTFSAASQTRPSQIPQPQQQQQQQQQQIRTLIQAAHDTKTLEMAEAHAAALRSQLQSQPLQIQLRLNMQNALRQHAKLQQASLRRRRPSPSDTSSSSSSSSSFDTPLLIAEQPPAYANTTVLGNTPGVVHDYASASSLPRVGFTEHPPPGNEQPTVMYQQQYVQPQQQAPMLYAYDDNGYPYQIDQTISPPPATAISPAFAYQPPAPTPYPPKPRITTPSNVADTSQHYSVPSAHSSAVPKEINTQVTSTVDAFEGTSVFEDQIAVERTLSGHSFLHQAPQQLTPHVSSQYQPKQQQSQPQVDQQFNRKRTLSMVKAPPDTSCDDLPTEPDELIAILLGGGVFRDLEQGAATPQQLSHEVIDYYTSRMSQEKKDQVLKALSTKLLEQYVNPTPPPGDDVVMKPIVSEPVTDNTVPSSVVLLDQAMFPGGASGKTTPNMPFADQPPPPTTPLPDPTPTPTDDVIPARRTPIVRTPLPIGPGASDPTSLLDPVFEWNEPPKPTLIERIKHKEYANREPSGSRYTASSSRTRDTPTSYGGMERKRSTRSHGREGSREREGTSSRAFGEFDALPSQPSQTAEDLQREITNLFMSIDPSIAGGGGGGGGGRPQYQQQQQHQHHPQQVSPHSMQHPAPMVPQPKQQQQQQNMIPIKVNVNYNRRTTESSTRSGSVLSHVVTSPSPQPRYGGYSPSRSLQYSESNPPPPPDENESDEETVVGSFA